LGDLSFLYGYERSLGESKNSLIIGKHSQMLIQDMYNDSDAGT